MTEKLAGVNSIMEALKGPRRVHKIFILEGRQSKKIEELVHYAREKAFLFSLWKKAVWMPCTPLATIRGR